MMMIIKLVISALILQQACLACYLDPAYRHYIEAQLEPFSEGVTQKMIELAKNKSKDLACHVIIKDHKVTSSNCRYQMAYQRSLCHIESIAKQLPDLEFILSVIDEPRVLKHQCQQDVVSFKDDCYCDKGYKLPYHALFRNPGFWSPLKQKVPIFGPTRISECFREIIVPSFFHFKNPPIVTRLHTPWKDREFKAYWRGAFSETTINSSDANFLDSHRVNLIESCKKIKDCDAGFTSYYNKTQEIKKYLKVKFPLAPFIKMRNQHKFKILIDIDGITYSSRFPQLLKLGAAVFKIGVFEDIATITVRPWEHYVPVAMDLSDLEQKLEWARTHDDELRQIAQRGMKRSQQVHNVQSFECYYKHLLLKYAELYNKGKGLNLSTAH